MSATRPPDRETMNAAVLHAFGEPLRTERMPLPRIEAGHALVRVEASGVNPLDTKIRLGEAAHARVTSLPAVLGIDVAGTVERVGDGVAGFEPGDAVYGMTGGVGGVPGSLADYAVVDVRLIAKRPAVWTARQAAAVPLAAITSWEGLVDRAGVRPGHKVLIHGGAGGVGHIAVQLANSHGADVYATGSVGSFPVLRELGATPIDRASSVRDQVDRYTAGEGFDIIMDTVGGATLDAAFESVRRYTGHVVSILGWGPHDLAPLSFRGASYSGVFTLLPLLTGQGRQHHGDILREFTALADAGLMTPVVDPRTFTLDTVADAHSAVKDGTARGKIVVDVHGPRTPSHHHRRSLMSPTSGLVDRYFQAAAKHDSDAVVGLFTADAVVVDEGTARHGTAEIRDWQDHASSTYEYTTTVLEQAPSGDSGWVATARLDGNFPGGTAELRYDFVVADGLISGLTIAP